MNYMKKLIGLLFLFLFSNLFAFIASADVLPPPGPLSFVSRIFEKPIFYVFAGFLIVMVWVIIRLVGGKKK